jgi:Ca2+-binding RTX toxin-like protein
MRRVGHPHRVPLRVLAVTVFAIGASFIAPLTASAATLCALDSGAHTLAVAGQGGAVVFRANGSFLDVNNVSCALLNGVDTVFVDMTGSPGQNAAFDLGNGPLGPGFTDEGNGSSEIEFRISSSASWGLYVQGSMGPDGVAFGQAFDLDTGLTTGQVNLNRLVDATADVDVVSTSLPFVTVASVGDGNDVVTGGGSGTFGSRAFSTPLRISDGAGADQVTGGASDDQVIVYFSDPSDGSDTWSGGAGVDTLDASAGTPPAFTNRSITLDDAANDGLACPGPSCGGDNVHADFEIIRGSPGSDTIVGDGDAETIVGEGGMDILDGAGGDDVLVAAEGEPETFHGGPGTDTVAFGSHLPFADQYNVPVYVTLDGAPNDGAQGQGSNVGDDVEVVIGTIRNDFLSGNAGPNTFDGFTGNDEIRGQGGGDTIIPGDGDDSVYGGGGSDTISYALSGFPLSIDMVARTATGEGIDTLSAVEVFLGSPFADVFHGAGANDRFKGAGGADDLFGAGGNDVLSGQKGNDDVDGGPGTDTCTQGGGSGAIVNCES